VKLYPLIEGFTVSVIHCFRVILYDQYCLSLSLSSSVI